MSKRTPPRIRKLSSAKQRRLDELLDRNSDGTITVKEKSTLERLVAEAEELMVLNTREMAKFAGAQSPGLPHNAVPVTIWVNPQLTQ